MKTTMKRLALITTFTIFGCGAAVAASNDYFITSCGTTIGKPGTYHLAQDLTCTTGNGITISSSNVSLLFGNKTLATTALGVGTGVTVTSGSNNVFIGGSGTITGFQEGISITGSSNDMVVNMTTSGNSDNGILLTGSSNNKVISNIAESNAAGIILISGSNNNVILTNRADNNRSYGIHLFQGVINNLIQANEAIGNNGKLDLRDENSDCSYNTWKANKFVTASPSCIN